MNRNLALPALRLAAFLLLISLAACTSVPIPPTPTATSLPPTATPEPTPTRTPTFTPVPSLPPQDAGIFHLRATLHPGEGYFRPIWLADGSGLIALASPGDSILYSTGDWTEILRYTPPAEQPVLDFSPDGHTLVRYADQQTVDLVDARTGEVLHTLTHSGAEYPMVSFSPDGIYLAMADWENEILAKIYRVNDGSLVWTLPGFETAAPVFHFKFVSGMRLVWVSRAHAQVMDIQTGDLGAPLLHEDFISAEAIDSDGKKLATAAGGMVNNEFVPLIFLWDAWSGNEIARIPATSYINSLAFSPDGSLLIAAVGGDVWIWDAHSLELQGTLTTSSESITGLTFSPDGKWLASAASDGSLLIWGR